MWTVLSIILWGLAAVLLLLLAALLSPLRIEARATAGDALRYSLALRPFGRFGPRFTVADSEKPSKPKAAKAEKKPKDQTVKTKRGDPRRILRAAVRLFTEIVAQLRLDRASLELRIGADDPAETGQIYGSLAPFIYGTQGSERLSVNVEPVFDRAIFNGQAALDISLMPVRLILPISRFGWAAFGPYK